MAISATIYKCSISIADMQRHYYQQHELTVAQHPSENDFRFIIRLIAFSLNACADLSFTKGLSTDDEPELWEKSLSDEILLWVDFGQVDEKRIRKACGRAKQVKVYTYNDRKSVEWWKQNEQKLSRYKNLSVFHLQADSAENLVNRKMQLQCNIDEDGILLFDEDLSIDVKLKTLKVSGAN